MTRTRALETLSSRLFDTFVLHPITMADRFLGKGAWDSLDKATGTLSRAVGRILRTSLSAEGPHSLSAAMELVDRCEGWVGVKGTWEIVDERTVLRKVPDCPFLKRLSGKPTFCTRLGLTMGKETLCTAFPDQKIDFEIQSTLSQGDPSCTYRLHLRPD